MLEYTDIVTILTMDSELGLGEINSMVMGIPGERTRDSNLHHSTKNCSRPDKETNFVHASRLNSTSRLA